MDRASKVLAARLPSDVPITWSALSESSDVPLSTLYHRAHGRPSPTKKWQNQKYLSTEEENVLLTFLMISSTMGEPVQIKYLPSLAHIIACRRASAMIDKPIKAPNKNWGQAFQKRHPELRARRVRAINWKRSNRNIYHKITEWFEWVQPILQNPAILPEGQILPQNVYSMDETGLHWVCVAPQKSL